ncbi:MAG: SDR family oxidoreductase [Clostridia bacterium]|nr:SDR family oxidoreductase [Clostridia bacterium]
MKIAVVTGASGGIGAATAACFLAHGYRVYGLSRSGKAADGVLGVTCDVTDEAAVRRAFHNIFREEGKIDVLVNNAGFGISGALEGTPDARAKKQFDVNFFGCFHCCSAVIPYMRAVGGGTIVNVSSMAAVLSIPFQSFYSASKSAVNALTLALANEVRPFGIRVCALMPGDVRTGFTAAREKNTTDAAVYTDTVRRSVAVMEHDEQNGMTPQQIAGAIFRLSQKRRPKPLSTTGAQYRVFAVLQKALPAALANRIVGMLYT